MDTSQNVRKPKRTLPKRTHILVKTYPYQNVPSKTYLPKRTKGLVKTYPHFGQNVPSHFAKYSSF